MPLVRSAISVGALLGVLFTAGCTSGGVAPEQLIRPQWRETTLPVPAGPQNRAMMRESVQCAGTWYVVGALGTPDGVDTRPAVWASHDGARWDLVPMTPKTYYGERSILYSVACRA